MFFPGGDGDCFQPSSPPSGALFALILMSLCNFIHSSSSLSPFMTVDCSTHQCFLHVAWLHFKNGTGFSETRRMMGWNNDPNYRILLLSSTNPRMRHTEKLGKHMAHSRMVECTIGCLTRMLSTYSKASLFCEATKIWGNFNLITA